MATRSGGGKLLRKPKPGYDQEFTLPKGTSAAPIKQVKILKKALKKIDRKLAPYAEEIAYIALPLTGGLAATGLGKIVKESRKKKEKKLEKNKGGLVNSRSIARKYFKGGLV